MIMVCVLASACFTKHKSRLTVIFDKVAHLEVGSNVYMKGLPIGKVIYLDLADNGVLAKIELEKDVHVPKGSKFLIDPSLLGMHPF